MTADEVRKTLEGVYTMGQRIQQLRSELLAVGNDAHTLQSFDYSKPVVRSSGGRGDVETAAIRSADRKSRLLQELDRLTRYRETALGMVMAIPDSTGRRIILARYFDGKPWIEVSKIVAYERRYCFKLKDAAIQDIVDTQKDTHNIL